MQQLTYSSSNQELPHHTIANLDMMNCFGLNVSFGVTCLLFVVDCMAIISDCFCHHLLLLKS